MPLPEHRRIIEWDSFLLLSRDTTIGQTLYSVIEEMRKGVLVMWQKI